MAEFSPVMEYILRVINGVKDDNMPIDFSDRCKKIKEMLDCDTTGIINTLLDYAITSAKKVNYSIETSNTNLTLILNDWLKNLNSDYKDKIPSGISELAKEYFSERWKKSSLIGLRVHWAQKDGLFLPDAMYLVDGASLKIDKANKEVLGNVKYSIGDLKLPGNKEDFIVRKPFAGWNDEVVPYLFMRGTYKNFIGIDMLKSKGNDVLNKIIPYILLLLKGNDEMTKKGQIATQTKMDTLQLKFKDWAKEYNTSSDNGTPVLGFPYDTKIEHLIPNLKNMVNKELYDQGYAAVLASLGVVEIANIGSLTRRETVFNPKPFIAETSNGVDDFRKLIEDVVILISEKNKINHRKQFSGNNDIKVSASTLILQVEAIIEEISKAFPRGVIDYQTYIEAMGLNYKVIKERSARDAKDGSKVIFYPKLTQNTEQTEDPNYSPEEKQKYVTQASLEKCKKCQQEFDYFATPENGMDSVKCPNCGENLSQTDIEFAVEEILGAPYNKLSDLPDYVKKYSKENQRKWMMIFNSAYKFYLKKFGDSKKAEQRAFQTANSRVKE